MDKPWKTPTAQEVKDKWSQIRDDMIDLRRNHLLNQAFFHGDQWLRWDDALSTASILQFKDGDDSLTRATVNKLKPRMNSLLARLCKTTLGFEPRPEGVDSWSIQRAELCKQVLEAKAHRDGWSQIRRQAVNYALLSGVSAIAVEPAFQFDDAPIPDGSGGQISVPSRPATKLTALSAPEFGLEPGTRDERDALYWIRNTVLTPAQTKREYGLDYTPSADAEAQMGVMQRALRSNRRGSTNAKGCMVLVYYERPTDDSPGCVLHVVNNDIVRQSGWTFPFKELNVTVFVETEIGGTWKGDTRMNDARQLQVQINRAYTSINANILRTDNNRILLPEGAVLDGEDDLDGTPGQIIRFNSEIGKPEWMQTPDVAARGMREHLAALESELDDLFNSHAVSRGQQLGSRNSGLALSILAEQDSTPLGLIAEDQQRGWQRIAQHVLQLERYLMEMVDSATAPMGAPPMQVSDVLMSNQNGQSAQQPKEITWTAKDLPEHPVVHVPLDTVMPKSRAAIVEQMLKLAVSIPTMFAQMSAPELAEVFQVADPSSFRTVLDPHIEEANWENARMASGEDENSVMIAPWQPHAVHIAEHNKFRATASYRDADPQVKQFVDLHVQAHTKLLVEDQQRQQAEQMKQAAMAQAMQPQAAPTKGNQAA